MAAHRRIVTAVLNGGGFAHGYTYAGNPLACSAGLAVLQELLDHKLIENAERQGRKLRAHLTGLMNRYPFIGDVRGKGLLLAFELAKDRESMEPLDPALNAYLALVDEAYRRGLIIYSRRTRGGTVGDHFMVCPPLIITDVQIGELMELLIASLDAFAESAGLPVNKEVAA
jgi:adenosylmethionine-8-amino-7-oxononanoate aminotransferase